MYEIIYAPVVQEKLVALKDRLIELCGEKIGKKQFLAVLDGFETRLVFSNTGIPIKTIYDVDEAFEKYFLIYSHKNYFLYFIEDNAVKVMELYQSFSELAAEYVNGR